MTPEQLIRDAIDQFCRETGVIINFDVHTTQFALGCEAREQLIRRIAQTQRTNETTNTNAPAEAEALA